MAYRAAHNVKEGHARPSVTHPKQTRINRTQTSSYGICLDRTQTASTTWNYLCHNMVRSVTSQVTMDMVEASHNSLQVEDQGQLQHMFNMLIQCPCLGIVLIQIRPMSRRSCPLRVVLSGIPPHKTHHIPQCLQCLRQCLRQCQRLGQFQRIRQCCVRLHWIIT